MKIVRLSILLFLILPLCSWGDEDLLFPFDEAKKVFGEAAIPSNKALFVDFWASWCSPCKDSFVEYNQLQKEFSKNIHFIAINEDTDKKEAEKFLKENKLNLQVLYDKDRTFARRLKVMALPTLFIFNAQGELKLMVRGYDKKRLPEIQKTLKDLQ